MIVFKWNSYFQITAEFPRKRADYVYPKGKTRLIAKDAKRQFEVELLKKKSHGNYS